MGDIYDSYKRLDNALNMPMPECKPPAPPLAPPRRKVTSGGMLLNQHKFDAVAEENLRRGYGQKPKVDKTEEFLQSRTKPPMPKPSPPIINKGHTPATEYSFWYIFCCGFATSSLFWTGVVLLKGYLL